MDRYLLVAAFIAGLVAVAWILVEQRRMAQWIGDLEKWSAGRLLDLEIQGTRARSD
jgi:hypothetical protein